MQNLKLAGVLNMPDGFLLKEIMDTRKCYKPFYDETQGKWFKFCSPCQQIKLIDEFKFNRKKPDCCKVCWNARQRKYYDRMPTEKKKAIRKRQIAVMTIEQKNARKEYEKNYFSNPKNRQRINQGQRKRYRTWTPEQREKYREVMNKGIRAYQARKMNAPFTISFSKNDIIKRDGLNCYLCEKLLTVEEVTLDHVLPLCRGGNHKPENAKIACKSCNSRKRHRTLTEFKKYRGDYFKFEKSFNRSFAANPQL